MDIQVPSLELYKKLPKGFKTELIKVFTKAHGINIQHYIDGRTPWTPILGNAFNTIEEDYYNYYLEWLREQKLKQKNKK